MEERLATLKAEFEKGQEELYRLEHRRQELYSALLRISGAIQVLEEIQQTPLQQVHAGPRSTAVA